MASIKIFLMKDITQGYQLTCPIAVSFYFVSGFTENINFICLTSM